MAAAGSTSGAETRSTSHAASVGPSGGRREARREALASTRAALEVVETDWERRSETEVEEDRLRPWSADRRRRAPLEPRPKPSRGRGAARRPCSARGTLLPRAARRADRAGLIPSVRVHAPGRRDGPRSRARCANGTPNTASTASPTNFSLSPPNRSTSALTSAKSSPWRTRSSSGSMRSPSAVDPATSAKRTVTTRRSSCVHSGAARRARSGVPHVGQNAAPGVPAPQTGHASPERRPA